MENFTPIAQRKAITMDYEEYLKLEKRANAFQNVLNDIILAQSLDDLKQQYLTILNDVNNTQQND